MNLGPLLWRGGQQAALELSLDEVIHLAEMLGFEFGEGDGKERRTRTVECEYTADERAMMRWIYKAELWIATKGS